MTQPDFDLLDPEASDKANQAEAEKLAARKRVENEDFKFVMSNARGRRFMYRFLAECGVWRTSYTGDNDTFFREGKRAIGLMLMQDLHSLCPDRYQKMIEEHADDSRESAK